MKHRFKHVFEGSMQAVLSRYYPVSIGNYYVHGRDHTFTEAREVMTTTLKADIEEIWELDETKLIEIQKDICEAAGLQIPRALADEAREIAKTLQDRAGVDLLLPPGMMGVANALGDT